MIKIGDKNAILPLDEASSRVRQSTLPTKKKRETEKTPRKENVDLYEAEIGGEKPKLGT